MTSIGVDPDRSRTATASVALSPEQLAKFEERGHLRLCEAFPPDLALRLQARMWAELQDDFGIRRDDRGTWYQPRRSLHGAKRDPLQSAIATERLIGAIDVLLSPVQWRMPSNWGVVLVTFPDQTQGQWALPSSGWHYDFDLHDNLVSGSRGRSAVTQRRSVAEHRLGERVVSHCARSDPNHESSWKRAASARSEMDPDQ